MTLEEWRVAERMSYQSLAQRLSLSTATHARRYALGIVDLPADLKEVAIAVSAGAVSLEAIHRQRLEYLNSKRDRRARPDALNVPGTDAGENDNPQPDITAAEVVG